MMKLITYNNESNLNIANNKNILEQNINIVADDTENNANDADNENHPGYIGYNMAIQLTDVGIA